MAEVYLAEKPGADGLAKTLVVKRILPELERDPELLRLFTREAELALNLRHPNLVQFYGFEQAGSERLLVMEYIDGVDAGRLGERALAEALVALIGVQALDGLAYLHDRPDGAVLHRDISPQNLLIDRHGFVRLADFGVAGRINSSQNKTQARGNWRYAAPERKQGEQEGPESDLYSLGLVLIELALGGRPELEGREERKAALESLKERGGGRLAHVLKSMVETDRQKRPTSAATAAAGLRPLLMQPEMDLRRELGQRVEQSLTMVPGNTGSARKTVPLPQTKKSSKQEPASSRSATKIAPVAILLTVALLLAALVSIWRISSPNDIEQVSSSLDSQTPILELLGPHALLPIDAKPDRDVWVDDRKAGKTPLQLKLPPGRHVITFMPLSEQETPHKEIVFLVPGANPEIYLK